MRGKRGKGERHLIESAVAWDYENLYSSEYDESHHSRR